MATQDPRSDVYYAALVEAWITTRMEKDRTVLTMSGGGIGILVTLATVKGVNSIEHLALYGLATLGFMVAIALVIAIFDVNRSYLEVEKVSFETNQPASVDPRLTLLDRGLMFAFMWGVVFSVIAAAVAAWPKSV